MIRVFHVDDLAHVRKGFAAMLRGAKDLSLVASAGSVREALDALAGGVDFEVAVVDLGLPDASGLEVLRAVRRARPRATPLAFTVFDDAAHLFDALRAGARGYLLKQTSPERMLAALREAAAGGAPLTPDIARRVVESFSQQAPEDGGAALTPRERDVLERLVRGETYAQVARNLGVSLSTVQSHVRAVYAKLEVGSKAEATREAIRRGLVAP